MISCEVPDGDNAAAKGVDTGANNCFGPLFDSVSNCCCDAKNCINDTSIDLLIYSSWKFYFFQILHHELIDCELSKHESK